MAKVNEEIVGGLMSALSRGEGLEKAMMTFYNAGYEKDEIEDSAKDVYNKLGPKAMGINGSLQATLDDIASKAGVAKKETPKEEAPAEEAVKDDKLDIKPIPDKKDFEPENPKKDNSANKPVVSIYGSDDHPSQYQNPDDITNKIQEAIKSLRPVNIPSKIEIVHKNEDTPQPTVIQHVSGYSEPPAKYASKTITYMLIFILILLLGALVAVFLFKDDLIQVFNELGLG